MPKKPKHPCAYPGCPQLVDYGSRYCAEHQRRASRDYEKYGRDRAAKRKYGRVWKKIRDSYVAAHPLCEECLKKGIYTQTEQVHHIQPLSEGGTHDRSNLMALCKSCHSRIHAERGDRWNNR